MWSINAEAAVHGIYGKTKGTSAAIHTANILIFLPTKYSDF